MYADDTVIYYAAPLISNVIPVLNTELSHLLNWSINNDLYIHSTISLVTVQIVTWRP